MAHCRTWMRTIHRWASLALGLPIALIAVSGAAVDYWFELDALTAPVFYRGHGTGLPVPLDRIVAAAHQALPGGRIESLFLNQDGRVAIASLTGPWGARLRDVAIDRVSGAVLGQRWQDEALINRLYDFHTTLLLGPAGRQVSRALVVLFLALLVTGIILWWPSLARLRAALAWRLAQGRPLLDFHSKLGVYSLVLTALAGTTALILLSPPARDTDGHASGASPLASSNRSLQMLVDAAGAAHPGWQAVNLLGVDTEDAPLRVILWQTAGAVRAEALQMVTVSRQDAVVAHAPLGDDHPLVRALHNGRIAGEIGRAATSAGATAPMVLWVTGVVHWAASRPRRPKRADRDS